MIKIAALFLWLLIPVTAYGVTLAVGAPHVLTARAGATCTYLGWGPHWVRVPTRDYRCAWVRFIKGAS